VFFLERKLLNERLAKNMVTWAHFGFSVDASIRIPGPTAGRRPARGVRPPVSVQKLLVDEGGTDTVVYRAAYSDYFHTDTKVFPAIEFLVELLQQLPDSRSPHLLRLAPEELQPELSVSVKHSRAAWARLIKKVYRRAP